LRPVGIPHRIQATWPRTFDRFRQEMTAQELAAYELAD
jgi:hypothetical protein